MRRPDAGGPVGVPVAWPTDGGRGQRPGARPHTLWRVTPVLSQLVPGILFGVTFAAWTVGEWVLVLRNLRSGAWRSRQDGGTNSLVTAGVLGGVVTGIVCAAHGVLGLPEPALWLLVGLVIAWAGLLLRLWAVLTLGPSFTTTVVVRPEQVVVATGPYRYVRHPAYLGLLVLFLGLGLMLGDLASAVAMVVLPAIPLAWRIRVEEDALRSELGSAYAEYAGGRARLIPGIW